MKVGSLFSGGGLGDFGFMAAGMEIAWQCEIDEYCQKILALRYPESKKSRDIKTLKGAELERVDIITGGFPCQPFSVAGKQKGKDDNRYLWPEMLRVIKECRPRWVVGENVPGIINLALDTVCADLEGEGYEVWPIVFPSHALGAWHKRDRLWLICHAKHDGQLTAQDARGIVQGSNDSTTRTKQASESKGPGKQYAPMANTGLLGQTKHEKQTAGVEQRGQDDDVADTRCQYEQRNSKRMETDKTKWSISELSIESGSERFRRWWATEPTVGGRLNGYPSWLDWHILKEMSVNDLFRTTKVLREMWNPTLSKTVWKVIGGFNRIQKAEILLSIMCEYKEDFNQARVLMESEEALKNFVRGLWLSKKITSTPHRPNPKEQQQGEHPNSLQALSRLLAHNMQEDWTVSSWEDGIPRVAEGVKSRVHRLKMLGNGQTPACTYVIGKMIMDINLTT